MVGQLRQGHVQPAEHGERHTGQLLQRGAEEKRELAPQLHVCWIGRPGGGIVYKEHTVLPEPTVITCIRRVH